MVKRYRRPYVPIELINEADMVMKCDGCKSRAEAMRKIAKEYSPTGREIKQLTTKKLLKNIFLGLK